MADERYYNSLVKLLPKGKLWQFSKDSYFGRFLRGISVEFSRLADKVKEMIAESFVKTSDQNIIDWEDEAGIMSPSAATLQRRRENVLFVFFTDNLNSFEFLINSLFLIGFVALIRKEKPLYVADFRAADRCNSYDWLTCFLIDVTAKTDGTSIVSADQETVEAELERIVVGYASFGLTYA